jgi:hypothetical protein
MTEVYDQLSSQDWHYLSKVLSKKNPEWSDSFVWSVIEEYWKFLAVKCIFRDYTALTVSPSSIVDKAWHADIMDTQTYFMRCKAITPDHTVIHHKPLVEDTVDEVHEKRCRYKTTWRALLNNFGYPREDVWELPFVKRYEPPSTRDNLFQIFYKTNKTYSLEISPNDSIGYVKQLIVDHYTETLGRDQYEIDADDIVIQYGYMHMSNNTKVSDTKIQPSSTVHVLFRARGC